MSRRQDGPQAFLQAFRGYLHADAYGGYDAISLESGKDVIEVACWAHARRKFFDARHNDPREAYQVLEWIQPPRAVCPDRPTAAEELLCRGHSLRPRDVP